MLFALTLVAVAALIIVVLALQTFVPFDRLSRDPLAVVGRSGAFHLGFLSNVGVLLWCATAAICLYGAARLHAHGLSPASASFLAYAGLLTGLLLLDDFFMLHEAANLYLGLKNVAFYMPYVLLMIGYVAWFRSTILSLGWGLLLLSVALFALSIAVDFLGSSATMSQGYWLLEDGAKFIGIAAWAGFHLHACWVLQNRSMTL